jgi:tetratricopeptide (TPR) repeat protein
LKDRPKEAGALVLRARLSLERRDAPKAITDLENAQKIEANMPMIPYMSGVAYTLLGNQERAQAGFEQAIALNPNFTRAYIALADMMLSRGQTQAALRYTDQVLDAKREPNNPEALLIAGSAYAAQGDLPKAKTAFNRFSELAPDSAQGPYRLGLVSIKEKKFDDAIKMLEKALTLNPKQYPAVDALAGVYILQGKNDKAIARVQQAIAQNEAGILYSYLGKVYVQSNKLPEGEQALKKALQLDGNDVASMSMLGTLYARQGSLDRAIVEYDQATRVHPNDAGLWTLYAMLNEDAGKADVARKAYEHALDLSPNSASAANNLAWILAQTGGDMDKALELARRAKVGMPDNPAIDDTLGWIYFKRQLYDSAVPLFQSAVKANPEHAKYQYHLAAALLSSGKKDQAKVAMSKALKLDATLAKQDEVKKVMGALNL